METTNLNTKEFVLTEDRFVYHNTTPVEPYTEGAYDRDLDRFAPALGQSEVDDLNAGRDSIWDWEWDPASEWGVSL